MLLDPLLLSRIQFAWVVAWHIVLPAIGAASLIAVLEGISRKTGRAACAPIWPDNKAEATPFLGTIGIAISLYPTIVPLTLWDAASSPRTQAFLLVGTLLLLPIILTYSAWSYWVFRGKLRSDIGYQKIGRRAP